MSMMPPTEYQTAMCLCGIVSTSRKAANGGRSHLRLVTCMQHRGRLHPEESAKPPVSAVEREAEVSPVGSGIPLEPSGSQLVGPGSLPGGKGSGGDGSGGTG